ncbi:hypothetical protein Cp1R7AA1_021 [Mesorhizobium phage Cp1R7A-A1]|nr:hypothetical protein Cp1R7AA1_021 [Mesorhizobium phage Cp1R7A-A1]
MTARDEMLNLLSDIHKDARGFRPSADYLRAAKALDDAELTKLWDSLCVEVEQSIEDDARAHAEAAKRFESSVAELIASGAGDRATAIRWLAQAHDAEHDPGYLEYQLGLPYHYLSKAA